MLMVISPAKSLDFSPPPEGLASTEPRFGQDTAALARTARNLTRADLKRMMTISDALAKLNQERFRSFDLDPAAGTVQAALAFDGDVYQGLDARNLRPADLDWAQDHLRILSGLYGLLRPLDRIQPYRLEMGVRVKTRRGESLYDYWGDRIARQLRADAEGHADPTLVNLASQEYFGAVDRKALRLPVVEVRFLEEKDGEARVLSFFAKKARGMMARWAIEHRVERAEELKAFDAGGYRFAPAASSEAEWTFSRPQPPPPR
jgi:cytoplasmic iron level regulating protein YaaA (DUF328/UPF0246 family)